MACTQVYVIDDVNVYGILNLCTAATSTTTSTTTAAPTTTSTTTTTTTAAPTTTSTTTTTTTAAPTTTSTTTTTTTAVPTTTSTTTTTTTEEPTTTSTTTTTTTEEPTTTSTTTTTTTEEPTTTSTTTTTTTAGIATFDGNFDLCVALGSTSSFRAQDGSVTSGHFTTTPTITANNCASNVTVSGTLTSLQGALKISIPSVPVGDTATEVSSSLGIVTGDATITTQIASGVLQYLITPNSYPTTIQLSGTITVTYP